MGKLTVKDRWRAMVGAQYYRVADHGRNERDGRVLVIDRVTELDEIANDADFADGNYFATADAAIYAAFRMLINCDEDDETLRGR